MIVLNQNKSGLKKGDIVTDTNDDSHFCGRQGMVIRIYSNGTAVVRFPIHMIPLGFYMYWEEKKPINVTYQGIKLDGLRKESDWDEKAFLQYETKRLFGRMFHSTYFHKKTFQKGIGCNIKECDKKAIGRSLINCFGTVYSFDLCRKHQKEWHGKCVEELPETQKIEH